MPFTEGQGKELPESMAVIVIMIEGFLFSHHILRSCLLGTRASGRFVISD